jgi:HPt (histidine-containing phosphotransfer) domain-containing protein
MEEYREAMSKLMEELGLTFNDLIDVYESYLVDIDECLTRLKLLLDKYSWLEVSNIVHSIKGMAGNLFFEDVYNKSSELNLLLKSEENNYSKECLSEYVGFIQESQEKVKSILKEYKNK